VKLWNNGSLPGRYVYSKLLDWNLDMLDETEQAGPCKNSKQIILTIWRISF